MWLGWKQPLTGHDVSRQNFKKHETSGRQDLETPQQVGASVVPVLGHHFSVSQGSLDSCRAQRQRASEK
jgi:hypothetical protein